MSDALLSDRNDNGWQRWQPDQLNDAAAQSGVSSASDHDAVPDDADPPSPESVCVAAQVDDLDEASQQSVSNSETEDIASCREHGFKEGYEAGYADGYQSGCEMAQREAGQLHAMLNACTQALARLDEEMSETLTELALTIARQIVRNTLQACPESIIGLVKDMLTLTDPYTAVLTLRMHPDDIRLIQTHLAPRVSTERLRLEADNEMERGGCMATSVLGDIDATMSTRWARMLKALGIACESGYQDEDSV